MILEFDVFVIGPMGKEKDQAGEQDTPISAHIRNIKRALNKILPDVVPAGMKAEVRIPQDGRTDIVDFVFNKIDGAEMIVADISTLSPSVMYELAYAHALGTPVIIIDDEAMAESRGTPFYLQGAQIVRVRSFDEPDDEDRLGELAQRLRAVLKTFFNPSDDQNFALNPLTGFYSAPLVETAGAATIARGYFRNLVSPIIDANGLMAQPGQEEIKRYCMLVPSPALTVNDDLKRIGAITRAWNGGETLPETVWEFDFARRKRKVSAMFIDGVVYDYPRTVGSLENSPRLTRVTQTGQPGGGLVDPAVRLRARVRVTSKLVEYFVQTVRNEVARNQDRVFTDCYEELTLDQFAERLAPRAT